MIQAYLLLLCFTDTVFIINWGLVATMHWASLSVPFFQLHLLTLCLGHILVILTLFQAFFIIIIFVVVICDPWCLMIPTTQWRLKMMVSVFSNKLLLKLRYICIYLDIMLLHTYIQYSVNVTFLCTGKSKTLHDLLYCNILQWYRMKSTESPRYACTLLMYFFWLCIWSPP